MTLTDDEAEVTVTFGMEVRAVADAVWQLIAEGVVDRTDTDLVKRACAVTGVPLEALRQAKWRADRGRYRPPPLEPVLAPRVPQPRPDRTERPPFNPPPSPPPAPPAPQRVRNAASARSRQPGPDDETLLCASCRIDQPLTLEMFPFRADRPHTRWTVCTPCRRARQNGRYLSAAKEAALASARVTFVVNETDELMDLVCTDCGQPFLLDQRVVGSTALRHEQCPET